MTRRQRNNLFIAIMLLAVVFIGVGYALSVQDLEVKGNTTIEDTVWKVSFTNIELDMSNSIEENKIANYVDTTANIDVKLLKPGSFALYHVTVKNNGTVPAKLYTIKKTADVSPIITSIYGIEEGEILAVGEERTFSVSIEWDETVTEVPTGGVTEAFSFILDFFQAK